MIEKVVDRLKGLTRSSLSEWTWKSFNGRYWVRRGTVHGYAWKETLILNLWDGDEHWQETLDISMPIKETILGEETKFIKQVKQWLNHPMMSPEDACKAWHSKGCPLEMAEELSTDTDIFNQLVNEHKAKGGNNFKAVYG